MASYKQYFFFPLLFLSSPCLFFFLPFSFCFSFPFPFLRFLFLEIENPGKLEKLLLGENILGVEAEVKHETKQASCSGYSSWKCICYLRHITVCHVESHGSFFCHAVPHQAADSLCLLQSALPHAAQYSTIRSGSRVAWRDAWN